MKIQIDLPEEADKKVELYKIAHNLKTKAEAAVAMLTEFEIKVVSK